MSSNTPKTILLLAANPQGTTPLRLDIVHFSGHGTGDDGLVFEDEIGMATLVDGESLAGLFELFAEQVECVVLNGCYSEVQATAIAQHVNYVIGMNKAIALLCKNWHKLLSVVGLTT